MSASLQGSYKEGTRAEWLSLEREFRELHNEAPNMWANLYSFVCRWDVGGERTQDFDSLAEDAAMADGHPGGPEARNSWLNSLKDYLLQSETRSNLIQTFSTCRVRPDYVSVPDMRPLEEHEPVPEEGLCFGEDVRIDHLCQASAGYCRHLATQARRAATQAAADNARPAEEAGAGKVLPDRLAKGKRCDQVVDDVRRIKKMHGDDGSSVTEIRKEWPDFAVWAIIDHLSSDDQDTFNHPGTWQYPTSYAQRILGKHYSRSWMTIRDWIKAYRAFRQGKQRKQGKKVRSKRSRARIARSSAAV